VKLRIHFFSFFFFSAMCERLVVRDAAGMFNLIAGAVGVGRGRARLTIIRSLAAGRTARGIAPASELDQ
jgi:hypothetical protein